MRYNVVYREPLRDLKGAVTVQQSACGNGIVRYQTETNLLYVSREDAEAERAALATRHPMFEFWVVPQEGGRPWRIHP